MKRYNDEGMRLTDCCGAYSTFCMDTGALICKMCYHDVYLGQGDGSETREHSEGPCITEGLGLEKIVVDFPALGEDE